MMISPAGALKGALSSKWYLGLAVSALSFGLFFIQTGLDLYKTGQKEWSFVLLSAGTGVAYGLVVIPLIASVMWVMLKAAKQTESVQAISAFCLSYSGRAHLRYLGLVFFPGVGAGKSSCLWRYRGFMGYRAHDVHHTGTDGWEKTP
jgi:hypothetical protein